MAIVVLNLERCYNTVTIVGEMSKIPSKILLCVLLLQVTSLSSVCVATHPL